MFRVLQIPKEMQDLEILNLVLVTIITLKTFLRQVSFHKNIHIGSNFVSNALFFCVATLLLCFNRWSFYDATFISIIFYSTTEHYVKQIWTCKFGRSGSDIDLTTPISMSGSQFPPCSTTLGIENINLDDDGKEKNSPCNKVKLIWSTEEEKVSCKILKYYNNDPKAGNAQKNKHLWQTTTKYYNNTRSEGTSMRELTTIKSHYYRVMTNVGKFSGWYNNSIRLVVDRSHL